VSAATVGEALAAARTLGVDRLDAQLLLARALGVPRTWVLAHADTALDAAARARFESDCARRAGGEPLAYLLGEKEFHGLRLVVDRRVLVPRPETETLVDWALDRLAELGAAPAVADLGTGSGAIALAVGHARPDARLCAVDASTDALAVARANGERLGITNVEWLHGDWWSALAGRRFDLALCNPPYVAGGDPHLAALRHEPALALTPGGDGLAALRAVVAGAPEHLAAGGWLLLEHGYDQAGPVTQLLLERGFDRVRTRSDLAGVARCTGGRLAARAS